MIPYCWASNFVRSPRQGIGSDLFTIRPVVVVHRPCGTAAAAAGRFFALAFSNFLTKRNKKGPDAAERLDTDAGLYSSQVLAVVLSVCGGEKQRSTGAHSSAKLHRITVHPSNFY